GGEEVARVLKGAHTLHRARETVAERLRGVLPRPAPRRAPQPRQLHQSGRGQDTIRSHSRSRIVARVSRRARWTYASRRATPAIVAVAVNPSQKISPVRIVCTTAAQNAMPARVQ